MKGTIVIVGICAIAALAISGLAAAGAIAATNGTTEFTCVKEPGGGAGAFKDSHCKESSAAGEFRHVAIAEKTEAEITMGVYKGTALFAVNVTAEEMGLALFATGVQGNGVMENLLSESGEHFVRMASNPKSAGLKFTGITPSNASCKVIGLPGGEGVIETKPLIATTAGQGMAIKFGPLEGTVVMEFEIVGTKCTPWKGTYQVEGTFKGTPAGATLNFSHPAMTTESTLRRKSTGAAVGFEGALTIAARLNNTQAYTPISPTTVETP